MTHRYRRPAPLIWQLTATIFCLKSSILTVATSFTLCGRLAHSVPFKITTARIARPAALVFTSPPHEHEVTDRDGAHSKRPDPYWLAAKMAHLSPHRAPRDPQVESSRDP